MLSVVPVGHPGCPQLQGEAKVSQPLCAEGLALVVPCCALRLCPQVRREGGQCLSRSDPGGSVGMFLSWEEPQGEAKVESQPGPPESRAFAPAPSVGKILCPPVACPVSPCVSWHSISL